MLLEQPGSTCSETYECTTTGSSEFVLKLDGQEIFSRSHSVYSEDGAEVNELAFDGYVTVRNLSKSSAKDCFDVLQNTTDFCFKTTFIVRLAPGTRCRLIECTTSTLFRTSLPNGTIETKNLTFGNATIANRSKLIARVPQLLPLCVIVSNFKF